MPSDRHAKASSNRGILTRIRARAIAASTWGSRCPAIKVAIIARPEAPKMSEATTDSLMQASVRHEALFVNGNRKLISCRQVNFDQFRVHSESAVSAGARPVPVFESVGVAA